MQSLLSTNLLPVAGTADQHWSASQHLCREGNYCDNSLVQVENNCVEGKYMPRLGAETEADCVSCPGGYMCESKRLCHEVLAASDSPLKTQF